MGLIDYSPYFQPIPQSPVARGLGSLGTALDAIMERRRLQKQHEEQERGLMERAKIEDERMRRQHDLNYEQQMADVAQRQEAARAASVSQQQRLQFDQQKAQGDALKEAEKLAADGSQDMAEEVMRRAGITRQMNNIEDIPLEEMLSYDVAPRASAGPTAQDMDEFERLGQPAIVEENRQTQGLYDRFNQQGLLMPDGSAVPFNGPPTLALRARRAAQALEPLQGQDPLVDTAIKDVPKFIEGGIMKPADTGAHVAEARKETQRNLRAEIAQRGASARQQATFEKPMSPVQIDSAARTTIKEYLDREGFKGTKHDLQEAKRLSGMTDVVAGGNWAAAGALAGMFAKLSQGGTGVLTDADMRVFWKELGSLEQKTWGKFQEWVSGRPTPEKLAELKKALAALQGHTRQKIDGMYGRAADLMNKYDEDGDRWMMASFGRGLPRYEKQRREEALKAAKAAKGAGGGK